MRSWSIRCISRSYKCCLSFCAGSHRIRCNRMKYCISFCYMPSFSQIQWACYKKWKVESEAQTGMCQFSTATFEKSYGGTVLDIAWVKGNDRADSLAGKKGTITGGVRLGRSEVLRILKRLLYTYIMWVEIYNIVLFLNMACLSETEWVTCTLYLDGCISCD